MLPEFGILILQYAILCVRKIPKKNYSVEVGYRKGYEGKDLFYLVISKIPMCLSSNGFFQVYSLTLLAKLVAK